MTQGFDEILETKEEETQTIRILGSGRTDIQNETDHAEHLSFRGQVQNEPFEPVIRFRERTDSVDHAYRNTGCYASVSP